MAQFIEKEALDDFQLVPAFVDNSEKWERELGYATRLGNEFKGKTTITVETTKGEIVISTTVWSVVGEYLQIKGGRLIPLKSIVEINY